MSSVYTERARVFKAFCEENRLRILELLQESDLCACALIERLGIKQPALSYHMKVLVESGIVDSTPVGKWTHYHISEKGCVYAQTLLHDLTAMQTKATEVCECANA
jgi:ArsR family transcriptional regulator, arsenate/arsenite/antimonite-responsive transcriptional repressor